MKFIYFRFNFQMKNQVKNNNDNNVHLNKIQIILVLNEKKEENLRLDSHESCFFLAAIHFSHFVMTINENKWLMTMLFMF